MREPSALAEGVQFAQCDVTDATSIEARVMHALGFRDDVLYVMAASDVFALSTRMEGLPVAVMEATALGLPLVLPAVGGLPDVVTDGEHGLLVTPERPDLLAEALVRVVDDAELRAHLSTGSAALAARFDARTAVSRIESIYEQVAR